MSMDLTGITNRNEYYTNHYLASIFEENAAGIIAAWRAEAKETPSIRTPWAFLRDAARLYFTLRERFTRCRTASEALECVQALADACLSALGYPKPAPEAVEVGDGLFAPVYLEIKKPNGAPILWVLLSAEAEDADILCQKARLPDGESANRTPVENPDNEALATKFYFLRSRPGSCCSSVCAKSH